jgi:hypothetical protein
VTAIILPNVNMTAQGQWAWIAAPSDGTNITAATAACDNDSPPSATKLFMYHQDDMGFDHSSLISSLRLGDSVFVAVTANPDSWNQWTVIGTPIETNNVWTIPVANYAGSAAGTEPPTGTPCLFEFRDTAGMRWVPYTGPPQSFRAQDLTRDGDWTMVANKNTSARPAPQPSGAAEDLLPIWTPATPNARATYTVANEWTINTAGWIDQYGIDIDGHNVGAVHQVTLQVNGVTKDTVTITPNVAETYWNNITPLVAVSGAVIRVQVQVTLVGNNQMYWWEQASLFATAPTYCSLAQGQKDGAAKSTTGYGCHCMFVPGTASPDWDVVAYGGEAAGGGGGGGGGTIPTPVSIANGGTGQTTPTAAYDALAPTTTANDFVYFNGTNNVRLPPPSPTPAGGAVGLVVAAGTPYWGETRAITTGWFVSPQNSTATYTSATSFTLSINGAPYMNVGSPIRWQQAGTNYYGYVVSCTTATNSVVTVVSASVVQNATITEWAVSTTGSPPDFPAYMPFTPTFTAGFATPPTGIADGFFVARGWCCYTIRHSTAGTSNAITYQFSAPFTAKTLTNGGWSGLCSVYDNGAVLTTPGLVRIISNTATFQGSKDTDTSADKWTATGNKRITFGTIWYPIR